MKKEIMPKHIAVILDGNRRYARNAGLPQFKGHEKGYNKIKDMLKWCTELGVKEITLYCFSTENFKRSREEVDYLFNLFRERVREFKKDKTVNEEKVRINFVGRLSMLPKDVQKGMLEVMEATKNYGNYKINLAFAYGSKSEIVDAFKKIISKGIKEIDENTVAENLYVANDVDILIRPGGEKRLSNFLLWQNSYAELFFIEKLWPEFTKEDLINIIDEFKKRERRFGG